MPRGAHGQRHSGRRAPASRTRSAASEAGPTHEPSAESEGRRLPPEDSTAPLPAPRDTGVSRGDVLSAPVKLGFSHLVNFGEQ